MSQPGMRKVISPSHMHGAPTHSGKVMPKGLQSQCLDTLGLWMGGGQEAHPQQVTCQCTVALPAGAETGPITLQRVCTHCTHTCPGPHQEAGLQCLLDRAVRRRLGRAQPTRDHRGSSGHWVPLGRWRQNGDWGTKNFRGGG